MKLKSYYTDYIKTKAIDLGFISCGISKSGFLNDEVNRFEKWLKNNYHGKMSYMERNFDKRMDTCLLYTSPSPRDRTRSRMPSSA